MMAAEEEAKEIEAEARAEAERTSAVKEIDAKDQDGTVPQERKVVQNMTGEQTQMEGQHEGMPKLVRAPVVRRRKSRRVKGPILLCVLLFSLSSH